MVIKNKDYEKYLSWAIVFVLVIISLIIIKNLVIALLTAFILAYITLPIYKKLSKKLGKSLSALICTLLILTILLLSLTFLIIGILNQTQAALSDSGLSNSLKNLFSLKIFQSLEIDSTTLKTQIGSTLISFIKDFTTNYIPELVLFALVALFGTYYFLLNWDKVINAIKDYTPFKNKEKLFTEISSATNSILKGTFILAIIEFVITCVGFYLSGVNYYLLAGVLIAVFAFIPGLGPIAVWIPIFLYNIILKDYWGAIGILITGLILSIGIDTIFRNKYLSNKTEINPIIMLVGIIGGISLFGIFGFIFGPLILYYTIKIVSEMKF